jgi:putative oxidoreductase
MYPYLFYFGFASIALLVLRVILGAIFIAHGWPKVSDLKKNGENFGHMGFKPGMFWGTIAALLEFIGGIAIVLGIATTFLSFFFAIEFITILVWRISKGHKFSGGWEFDLLIFAGLIVLIALGAGGFAFGRMMFAY